MLTLRIVAVSACLALGACTQNDTNITQRVQDRLAEAAVSEQVKVTTERRVVHLEGVVRDTNELNRAEMAARNVPGVIGVDNRLVVQSAVTTTGGSVKPPTSPAGPEAPKPAPTQPASP